MVVGTDISELLLKNKTEFPYETTSTHSSKNSTTSRRNSVESESKIIADVVAASRDSLDRVGSSGSNDLDTISSNIAPLNVKTISVEEVTEKFRNYLLYGSVIEALEWATDNNLWGHALFLASKVDRRSHANVMMKFANKLSLNDPLQTLYQLMSGRTPNSVTVSDSIFFFLLFFFYINNQKFAEYTRRKMG